MVARARNGTNLSPGTCLLRDFLVIFVPCIMQNVHFMYCSDKAFPLDLSCPIAQELRALEEQGIEVFDSFLQQMVLVVAPLMCIVCDNPRASELLNHLGSKAVKYCRFCMVRLRIALYIHVYTSNAIRLTEPQTLTISMKDGPDPLPCNRLKILCLRQQKRVKRRCACCTD